METTENPNPAVPVTDNKVETENVKPTPEVQPQSAPVQEVQQETSSTPAPEVQSQPTTPLSPENQTQSTPDSVPEAQSQPASNVTVNENNDDEVKGTVQVNGNTVTIDAQPYVSELFNKNPGEIAEVFNMDPKTLKKEQNKLKKKGFAMDNKYANLFLLQSIRDECGVLVIGCLASWFLTRIGLSIYWTFFVMVATLMAYITYNNRKKHLYYNKERKAYKQKVKLNPENPETLNWLNYILRKAWPTAEPLICNIVMDSVNGILDDILNNPIISNVLVAVDSIKISEFSLGTEAPMLMEMCPNTDSDPNVIKFTCVAKYEPLDPNKISKYDIESGEKRASNIILSIKPKLVPKGVPTQVNDILFIGKLLFVITTMEAFPYIKKVEFTFLEQPSVKWTLKPLSAGIDIMKLGLDKGIDLIIKNVISNIALEPTRFTIDVEDLLKSMTLDQPIGLLKLNFYEGKELKNTSKMGKDDPYAKFSVNGIELSRTKIVDNDLNPTWNHTEYAIVSGVVYSDPKNNSDLALIEVLSDNSLKKDNVMGRAENFYLRQYIALCEILRKKKIDEEREAAFIENLNKQGIFDEQEIARIRKEENKKRKKELALKEKNKSFAQKLLSNLEVSAEDYINGLTDVERKNYINQWGNPLIDSDTIIPLYQLGKDGNIDKNKPAGTIRMGINYIPLNQFNENLDSNNNNNEEIFSETGIARIWIYKVQKLEGSPNPYCIAEIDGVEVLRTSKKKYNNNPGFNSFKDVFIKNFSTAKLTVDVKDSKTGSDATIGTFEWNIYEMYERLKEDPSANWFKLSSKFDEAAINLGLEWKPMIMNMSSNLLKPIGVCRLHLKAAKNLKNVETFSLTDSYVKINLSGKEVGITDVVDDDLNPEYREVYYLMIRSKNDRLSFEVFNYSDMKNNVKIGKVEMNVTDICRNIIFNGEQSALSKAWENMNPTPEIKKTKTGTTFVSVPIFENQVANKVSQGRIEFDLDFFGIADLGLNTEENKEDQKEEELGEDILASENTDRTFIDKVQASNLLSGILRVKVYSIKDLPNEIFYNIDSYFEDEPYNILLSTPRSSKPGKEGNIDEIVEGFVRNYKNTKIVFAINEKNGTSVKKVAKLVVPIENLLIGKLNINKPFVHICDNGTTKIKLGVEYEPLDMHLERSELSPQMGVMNVNIDKANVIGKDSSGTSDPYVKVIFRGQEIYKTDTVKKTLTPVWNENFKLDIADRITNKLIFQVFDWNKLQKHDLIGQAQIPLYEVYDGERISINNPPLPLIAYDKGGNKIENGSISINIEFTPTIHNIRMNDRLANNNNAAMKLAGGVVGGVGTVAGGVVGGVGSVAGGVASGVGSIARGIGLKKTNKNSGGGSSLKIKVIMAEELKAVDNSGTSDPYVKVQHQKKTLYKTKPIKKNLSPVWNEECTIPFDRETSDPIISFIIKDSNKFGKSVDLGMVEVNVNDVLFNASQASIDKLFDVQNGPGRLQLQIEYVESGEVAAATAQAQPVAESP